MPVNQLENVRLSDVLKFETDQRFCREEIVLDASDFASLARLKSGMILEPGTDTAMKGPIDGVDVADSILLYVFAPSDVAKADPLTEFTMLDNTTDLDAIILARGSAIVDKRLLDYFSQTEATINTLLEALGILVRVGPDYSVGPKRN